MKKLRGVLCRGRGGDFSIACPDCNGSGYARSDEKPFGQCHTCYGEGEVQVDECSRCFGVGLEPKD